MVRGAVNHQGIVFGQWLPWLIL